MEAGVQVTIDLDLEFSTAGIGFTIEIHPGKEAEGAALLLRLRALEEGTSARFAKESSYALGDFVGGLCRWLGTQKVTVSHTDQEITGHFHPGYTVPQILSTTQGLCQMLEDKFAAYPHSVLT
jgi:hypothetical protein